LIDWRADGARPPDSESGVRQMFAWCGGLSIEALWTAFALAASSLSAFINRGQRRQLTYHGVVVKKCFLPVKRLFDRNRSSKTPIDLLDAQWKMRAIRIIVASPLFD